MQSTRHCKPDSMKLASRWDHLGGPQALNGRASRLDGIRTLWSNALFAKHVGSHLNDCARTLTRKVGTMKKQLLLATVGCLICACGMIAAQPARDDVRAGTAPQADSEFRDKVLVVFAKY